MNKLLLIVLTATAALLVGGMPVLAGEVNTYGSSVDCRYKTTDGDDFAGHAKIRKIVVTPPTMFAKSGNQKVGWRFEVNRTYRSDPAVTTYQSPTKTAFASTTSAAPFNAMSVGVVLPQVEERSWLSYRVTLKLFWYRANGSVQSKKSVLIPSYDLFYNGAWDGGYDRCDAIMRWGP